MSQQHKAPISLSQPLSSTSTTTAKSTSTTGGASSTSTTSLLPPLPSFSSLTLNSTTGASTSTSTTSRKSQKIPPGDTAATPANSQSTMPPPSQSTATHHILPPPLPVINLGFDELRDRMNRFTIRFDEFIEKGRRRLLVEKNEFARNVAEDKDSARAMRAKIEHYKEREREIQEQHAREAEETAEAELTILTMSRTRQQKLDHLSLLQAQLTAIESTISRKRALRSRERASLATLASHNLPELTFWEDHLCMRIEGAGAADHLKIVFTHILDSDWDREASFVVVMTTRWYQVEQVRPRMKSQDVVDRAVERLNETRNFAVFLKEMRMGFVEAGEAGLWR